MLLLSGEKLIDVLIYGCVAVMLSHGVSASTTTSNLTCFQCERRDERECDASDLKPCASSFDRCAISMKKEANGELTINRTCGLAPCGFDDEMMAKGLGMNCDKSKETYSCVFCCKGNGCNKNAANLEASSSILLLFGCLVLILFNLQTTWQKNNYLTDSSITKF